jgi:hypothetical protein
MSGARIIFPEFRDEQSDSRYPFTDTAALTADSGVELPRDTFIDAAVYAIDAIAPLYISSIAVTASAVTINISTQTGDVVCSTAYIPLDPPVSGELVLVDVYGRPAGLLLSSRTRLALIGGWEPITHTFAQSATEFVAGVVYPAQEPGVRGLTLAANTADLITADIWLIGRDGIILRADPPNSNVIRVDIVGVPLFKRLECVVDATEDGTVIGVRPTGTFTPKTFLRTVNGYGPDQFGNFNITVAAKASDATVLRIYPENDVIKITAAGSKVL